MKVLLINPPWTVEKGYGLRSNTRWPHVRKDKYLQFPIYLAYSAAVLEEAGVEVKVIDAVKEEYNQEALAERVRAEEAEICFLETSTPTIEEDLETAACLKKQTGTSVFLFGPHATTFHREILGKNEFIEGIIRGEFEYTIRDVSLGKRYKDIPGLTYREGNGNSPVKVNEDRPLIENLDELPFPSWHQFEMEAYESHLYRSPSVMMITSRGCPFRCTFCLWPDVMYGHKQRFRSPESICDEIGFLIERFGVQEIRFDDDTFALNRRQVMAICDEIIGRGYHKEISWTCFGHITQDDREMYERMVEAGCFKVDFGVESGSHRVLDRVGKKIDMEKARKTVQVCKEVGLAVYCDFMVGFPYETEEDILKSIEAAVRLDPDYIQVSYVIPYPGTRMYAEGIKENYLLHPGDWKMYSSCKPLISLGELSPGRVEELYHQFWKKFYLRPRFVLRAMKRAFSSLSEFKRMWRGFISFYRRFLKA